MIRKIEATESQIQCTIVDWANNTNYLNNRKIGDFLIKITNEGKRSIFQGRKMKREGLKKGVSDLFLAIPLVDINSFSPSGIIYTISGLWIEVKTKIGKVTKEQDQWGSDMKIMGYSFEIVRGVDEGIQAIKDYLVMK
jgi:hypothetical protein